ncbi:hypothetical protein Mal4_06030 [Maioricimonas rarisocia]|uniref:Uncharacterized protein n=1 Tax=Maioricimonas rarisocia TaxID=2528026 RepID=A0A517Z1H5_9PLAN|nr:hypothetical protein Mal4_06030 [Maioricimonas rarisocia]
MISSLQNRRRASHGEPIPARSASECTGKQECLPHLPSSAVGCVTTNRLSAFHDDRHPETNSPVTHRSNQTDTLQTTGRCVASGDGTLHPPAIPARSASECTGRQECLPHLPSSAVGCVTANRLSAFQDDRHPATNSPVTHRSNQADTLQTTGRCVASGDGTLHPPAMPARNASECTGRPKCLPHLSSSAVGCVTLSSHSTGSPGGARRTHRASPITQSFHVPPRSISHVQADHPVSGEIDLL